MAKWVVKPRALPRSCFHLGRANEDDGPFLELDKEYKLHDGDPYLRMYLSKAAIDWAVLHAENSPYQNWGDTEEKDEEIRVLKEKLKDARRDKRKAEAVAEKLKEGFSDEVKELLA